jgi:hypothetical protein
LDLVPEQAYSLRIVGSAPLANGQSLGTDFVAGFVVQPVRVRSVYPTNASTNVPLSQNINIEFNTPMESISTVRAVVLRPLGGAPVGIDVSWYSENRSLSLSATRGLEPSTSYELSVSTEARDQRGHAPRSAWRIVFRTRQY